MLGGVHRRHLDRGDGPQTLGDRVAHDAVHVALIDERARMAVVGAQDEIARIDPLLRHRLHLLGNVVPGRTEPQHRLHALTHSGDGVSGAGSLVIVRGAAGDIAMERQTQIRRCVMAADRLAGAHRLGDRGDHRRVVGRHAREIHHLAKADDVLPPDRLRELVGAERSAGMLQAGCRRHAGRKLDIDIDRHGERLVMHQPSPQGRARWRSRADR